jgi:hypothetical protein
MTTTALIHLPAVAFGSFLEGTVNVGALVLVNVRAAWMQIEEWGSP